MCQRTERRSSHRPGLRCRPVILQVARAQHLPIAASSSPLARIISDIFCFLPNFLRNLILSKENKKLLTVCWNWRRSVFFQTLLQERPRFRKYSLAARLLQSWPYLGGIEAGECVIFRPFFPSFSSFSNSTPPSNKTFSF